MRSWPTDHAALIAICGTEIPNRRDLAVSCFHRASILMAVCNDAVGIGQCASDDGIPFGRKPPNRRPYKGTERSSLHQRCEIGRQFGINQGVQRLIINVRQRD